MCDIDISNLNNIKNLLQNSQSTTDFYDKKPEIKQLINDLMMRIKSLEKSNQSLKLANQNLENQSSIDHVENRELQITNQNYKEQLKIASKEKWHQDNAQLKDITSYQDIKLEVDNYIQKLKELEIKYVNQFNEVLAVINQMLEQLKEGPDGAFDESDTLYEHYFIHQEAIQSFLDDFKNIHGTVRSEAFKFNFDQIKNLYQSYEFLYQIFELTMANNEVQKLNQDNLLYHKKHNAELLEKNNQLNIINDELAEENVRLKSDLNIINDGISSPDIDLAKKLFSLNNANMELTSQIADAENLKKRNLDLEAQLATCKQKLILQDLNDTDLTSQIDAITVENGRLQSLIKDYEDQIQFLKNSLEKYQAIAAYRKSCIDDLKAQNIQNINLTKKDIATEYNVLNSKFNMLYDACNDIYKFDDDCQTNISEAVSRIKNNQFNNFYYNILITGFAFSVFLNLILIIKLIINNKNNKYQRVKDKRINTLNNNVDRKKKN